MYKKVKKIREFGNKQHCCKECKSVSFKEYYNNNEEKFKENLKNDYKNRKREILCTCGRVIIRVGSLLENQPLLQSLFIIIIIIFFFISSL